MKARQLLLGAGFAGVLIGAMWGSIPPALLMSPEEIAQAEASANYAGCDEVRAPGKAPLYAGQPGYRETMDGDGDGMACEPVRN